MTPVQRAAALRLADALDADDFDIMHDAATILRELAAGPNQWRDTVDDMLTTQHEVASDDPRESINRLINWNVSVSLDPAVSSAAQALIEQGKKLHAEPLTDEQIDAAVQQTSDALLDHIYEYGTAAEGIQHRVRLLARAVEAAHGIKETK